MLDIYLVSNNRPLSYCEDDIQLLVLTPNMMIFGRANYLMELSPEDIEERDPQRKAKYLKKCEDALWQRWRREFMRALRERHNTWRKERELRKVDVVLIKATERIVHCGKLGLLNNLYPDEMEWFVELDYVQEVSLLSERARDDGLLLI